MNENRLNYRHLALAAVLLVGAVPLFVRIPPHLRGDPLIGALGNRYHVFLFAALVLILHRWGPLRGRLVSVVLTCIFLGAVTELVQVPFGRSATLWDWYLDGLGVALGASVIWWTRGRHRWLAVVSAAVVAGLIAWPMRELPVKVRESRAVAQSFPLLADFERPGALILWGEDGNTTVSVVPAADHGQVLQIDHEGEGGWIGAGSRHLPWDWSGYETLSFEARLAVPSPESLHVKVWLQDRLGSRDSADAVFGIQLNHDWQTLRVPLRELRTIAGKRPLALDDVALLTFILRRKGPEHATVQIDNIRLE